MNKSQQTELELCVIRGGSYRVGPNVATWQHRVNDEKVVDLSFRGKDFEVTCEGSGPNGRPRMFINGIRKSDGKLFQARSLLDLVRTLNDHFNDFVEIPARLLRIEQKLDVLLGPKRRIARTKLCLSPIKPTWRQARYIPKESFGGFARVPIPTIPASQQMAVGEFRILMAMLFCAQGTGLLTAGKNRLSTLAKVPEEHVKIYRRSLCNRQLIRPTGRILPSGAREYELLTHPWLCEGNLLRGQKTDEGGQISAKRGATVVPLKKNKTNPNKTNNKKVVIRLKDEEEMLQQIGQISHKEMVEHGGMWRKRIRHCRNAVLYAIEDWKVRTPAQRSEIKNPGGWLNDRYARALVEIHLAKVQSA